MIHNKLVRDNIPEIIKTSGKHPVIHIADQKEYWEKLLEKLEEEVGEFIDERNPNELADVLEVIDAIAHFMEIPREKIFAIKEKKAQQRGRFTKRIILDEVLEDY